jgi:hypothetical protein
MTTTAKKFGGPYGLAAFIALAGYGVGKIIEISFKTGARYVEAKKKPDQPNRLIEVTSAGTDGSDLAFREGDSYRILYSDEDMVLIEKVGDTNNPYMVSPDFLRTVSNHE